MKLDSLQDFFSELDTQISGSLRTDQYSRVLYSTDASIYQCMPLGVLVPAHEDDVEAAVSLAAKYAIPILPRTGGSSLAGQAVNEALVIDFTPNLSKILEVDKEAKWARVQPGVVLDVLNIHLKKYDLQFGPDPASSNRAAMGGIVSNNSTGAHSILYGMTADHLLETKVYLSDGSAAHFEPIDRYMLARKQLGNSLEAKIYREIDAIAQSESDVILAGTPKHWRRCGGYNLDRFIDGSSFRNPRDTRFNLSNLVCGAEGTLAVISEIKLKLVDRPKKTALAILQFDDLFSALSATPIVLEQHPSAIELLDNLAITLCADVPEYARLLKTFMSGQPNCMLVTEFYGESEKELTSKIDGLKRHLSNRGVKTNIVPALDPRLQQNVWTVRKVGLGLLMSIKGDHKPIPFIEDAAVPPEHLAEYISRIEAFCNDLGTRVAYYAHASAGCLHVRPLINAKVASDINKLPEIGAFSAELVGEYGGALSSEHGDGRARSWLSESFYGKDLYRLYKRVKNAFDPDNRLNPNVVVNAKDMREHLRYGENYSARQLDTVYDFSSEQGFDRAIELCNGAGICRKTTTGTLCPSFMVTREEQDSTRGRANALRSALSGDLDFDEFTSKEMYEVMDLCIECKACKAECPSSVDMARIKFEFLAQYYQKNRMPVRSQVFSNIDRLSRLGSGLLAPLLNSWQASSAGRALATRFLGISRFRTLPQFSSEPFSYYTHPELPTANTDAMPEVVLLVDTFNNFYDPDVLEAARHVLQACGFHIHLSGRGCCGRPALSKGNYKRARILAQETLSRLAPFAQRGIPIIGLEPSCLLTIREEYPLVCSDHESLEAVCRSAVMIEEFLSETEAVTAGRFVSNASNDDILLHGHCHQKSLIGTNPLKSMLAATGNVNVAEIDSGCCGMAGSFGYEAEHYDISLEMANRRLAPEVNKVAASTRIAASGFSCRHQIKHTTGRTAEHPIQTVARYLIPPQNK